MSAPDELAEARAALDRALSNARETWPENMCAGAGRKWLSDKIEECRARVRALESGTRRERVISDEVAALRRKMADAETELERLREFAAEVRRRSGRPWVVRVWDAVDAALAAGKGGKGS